MGINPDRVKKENKEVENFQKTLDYLISEDAYTKAIVVTENINL